MRLTHGRRKARCRLPDNQFPRLRLDERDGARTRPARRSAGPGRAATGGSSSAAGRARRASGVSSQPTTESSRGTASPRARAASQRADGQLVAHAQQPGRRARGRRAARPPRPLAVLAVVGLHLAADGDAVALEPPARDAVRGRLGPQRAVGAVRERERQGEHRQPRVAQLPQMLRGRGAAAARSSIATNGWPSSRGPLCTTTGSRRRRTASTSGCPSGTA